MTMSQCQGHEAMSHYQGHGTIFGEHCIYNYIFIPNRWPCYGSLKCVFFLTLVMGQGSCALLYDVGLSIAVYD